MAEPNHVYHSWPCEHNCRSRKEGQAVCYGCRIPVNAVDSLGRSLLHLASTSGNLDLAHWLISTKAADPNLRDTESGYTPLHKSILYGQIAMSKLLLDSGANLEVLDHEGLSPMELAAKEIFNGTNSGRQPPPTSMSLSQIYVWGQNSNFNLGLGHQDLRRHPELLNFSSNKKELWVYMAMNKYHSAFVSSSGKVFTCGLGHGGRLGHGNTDPQLIPQPVEALLRCEVQMVALGLEHSLFMSKAGRLYSCGLNNFHQLGIDPAPECLLQPKPISRLQQEAVHIAAGSHHSICVTGDGLLYTWGLNSGQLGHAESNDTTVSLPRQVTALKAVVLACTNDWATAVITSSRDLFLLTGFQVTRLVILKDDKVLKIQVIGSGVTPVAPLGSPASKEGGKAPKVGNDQPIRILMLTSTGDILVCDESRILTRCFTAGKVMSFVDFAANWNSMFAITNEGLGYELTLPTKTKTAFKGSVITICKVAVKCRLRGILRAVAIFSDPQGRNVGVIQRLPCSYLTMMHQISPSSFSSDMEQLLDDGGDSLHDIVIRVQGQAFYAHRFIVASCCPKLANLMIQAGDVINLDHLEPHAFRPLLHSMYTGVCGPCETGGEDTDPDQIRKDMKAAAEALGMHDFWSNNSGKSSKLSLYPDQYPELSDATIQSEKDGRKFNVHRCVLAARLPYFRSMFCCPWLENSRDSGAKTQLTLPWSGQTLRNLIRYLYTDRLPPLDKKPIDADMMCELLLAADQVLAPRLIQMCEMRLAQMLTLSNVISILNLAHLLPHTLELKKSAMEFICLNIVAILETRALDDLNEDCLFELSDFYSELFRLPFLGRCLPPIEDSTLIDQFIDTVIDTFSSYKILQSDISTSGKLSSSKKRRSRKGSSGCENLLKDESKDIKMTSLTMANATAMDKVTATPDSDLDTTGSLSSAASPDKTSAPSSSGRKKFLQTPSQKERKRLAWLANQPSPEDKDASRTKWSGWASSPPENGAANDLESIMRAEKSQQPTQRVRGVSLSDNSPSSSLSSSSDKKRGSWRKLSLSESGSAGKKTWDRTCSISEEDDRPSFHSIMTEDMLHSENLARACSKPLWATQAEEAAIEQLKAFYNVHGVFDEYITVSLARESVSATPIWKRSK